MWANLESKILYCNGFGWLRSYQTYVGYILEYVLLCGSGLPPLPLASAWDSFRLTCLQLFWDTHIDISTDVNNKNAFFFVFLNKKNQQIFTALDWLIIRSYWQKKQQLILVHLKKFVFCKRFCYLLIQIFTQIFNSLESMWFETVCSTVAVRFCDCFGFLWCWL